jgi:methyl-accepting chemotaxis protein
VPGTDPQEYRTSYTGAFTQELQAVLDQARADLGSSYAVAVDVNGYLPAHHSDLSLPPTGDPRVDLPRSRHQRIYFTLDTERRRVRKTESFLLQTYMRDTGEIMNDLSLPIHLQGRHWGALVMGTRRNASSRREPEDGPQIGGYEHTRVRLGGFRGLDGSRS